MRRALLLVVAGFLLHASMAVAQEGPIGQIKTASGTATVVRGDEEQAATVGDRVYQNDVLVTGADGAIGVTFKDNSVFSAGPGSRIALEQFRFDSSRMQGDFLAAVEKGTLSVESGDIARGSPDAMKIRTPGAVLAVRGTAFLVRVEGN